MKVFFCLFFLSSLFGFYMSRKKLLLCLMTLEAMILVLFVMMVAFLWMMEVGVSFSLYMLVLGACEASLGLSILISLTRFKGNDMLGLVMYNF